MPLPEFSIKTRQQSLEAFQRDEFDFFVIGGGITGAAVARDASSRGLRVALVERKDFAWGTSSRSSKLIHGGLRYLQNAEMGLVFEALSERTHLLASAPHRVKPLEFYFPVYQTDPRGRFFLGIGMWLYDLLSLFRSPGFHRFLSKKKFLSAIPFINHKGLKGAFRYFDASMWDDLLVIDTIRSAQELGAKVANYVEAVEPIFSEGMIRGFRVRDGESSSRTMIDIRAKKVIVCAGPWTDEVGSRLSPDWKPWLKPSKGIHLVFDLKRIPIPGALVMSHPEDGRVSFVIPRPDYGSGVALVGTTDGPTDRNPDRAVVEKSDVDYLLTLLDRYFPKLKVGTSDILSAYVGVRPLMAPAGESGASQGSGKGNGAALQKLSREHFIGEGVGGVTIVAGGKYTTHRCMAKEIVDFTLQTAPHFPGPIRPADTDSPANGALAPERIAAALRETERKGWPAPRELFERYGSEAVEVLSIHDRERARLEKLCPRDPEGFPFLAAQLVYTMRKEMVLHLEDFYLRRVPLYLSRKDHGLAWADGLLELWGEERGLSRDRWGEEKIRFLAELHARSAWEGELAKPMARVGGKHG